MQSGGSWEDGGSAEGGSSRRALVMEGFVGVNKEPEMASLLDLDPVEVFQVLGDVGSQSGSCVLDHMESLKEFGSGA